MDAKKMTVDDVSREFNVTTSWVWKTIRDLSFDSFGRGRQRFFSEEEVGTISLVIAMRKCNFKWDEIKAVNESDVSDAKMLEVKKLVESLHQNLNDQNKTLDQLIGWASEKKRRNRRLSLALNGRVG